jgi:hypothetical protein
MGHQYCSVRAATSRNLLDGVQVGQMLTVDDDVAGTAYACDAVDPEADGLVDRDPEIDQQDRNNQRVDDRR